MASTGAWANPSALTSHGNGPGLHIVKGMGLTLQIILQLTVQCVLLRVTMLGLDMTLI